jgi:hypothetical protein
MTDNDVQKWDSWGTGQKTWHRHIDVIIKDMDKLSTKKN